MKILHISKYYYPFKGGTEQTARDCVNSLASKFDQKVICFNHEKGESIDYIDGIQIIRCACIAKVSSQSISLSYSKHLKMLFKEYQPDIIIFHYPNPFVCYFLLKQIPLNVKLIVYWHLDIIKQKILGKFFINQNYALLQRADLILATSPNYVQGSPYLSKAKEKCKIIPSCINEKRLVMTEKAFNLSKEIRKQNKDKIICLAIGRHTEYKGFKYLIKASRFLDDRFVLFITGIGEETESLKKEAKGDPKIHFLGLIDDDELKAYLNAMDIFCFPSITKNEAFGLALAEGMFYGKPAVTFNIPGSGVNYVCINGEDGIEVENRNITAYAKAMTILADNPELRNKMGRNGKKRIENNFLYKQFQENIYNAIVGVIK